MCGCSCDEDSDVGRGIVNTIGAILIVLGIVFIVLGKTMYYDPIRICLPEFTMCKYDYTKDSGCFNSTNIFSSKCKNDMIFCGNFCSYNKDIIDTIILNNPERNTGVGLIVSGSIFLIIGAFFSATAAPQ